MTLVDRLMARTGCSQLVAEDLLETAKSIVLNRRYPFVKELPLEVEPRYIEVQLQVAQWLYNKTGAEGELQHSELGETRVYKDSDIPNEILKQVTPYLGLI